MDLINELKIVVGSCDYNVCLVLVDITSTALVVVGVGICLAYGPSEPMKFANVEELLDLIMRPTAMLFVAAVIAFIGACAGHAFREQRRSPGKFRLSVAAAYPVMAGTAGSLTGKGEKSWKVLALLDIW